MKKIYLLAFSFCIGSSLFAQFDVKTYNRKPELTRENCAPMTPNRVDLSGNHQVGMRTVILTENFETVAGPFPATIPGTWSTTEVLKTNGTSTATDDFNGPAFEIHNSTTANTGGYWPVAETGSGNLFAGANDDAPPCDCVSTQINIQTPAMDFSTAVYPAVTFDIYHDGNFGAGDAFVSVSTDGGAVWNTVPYPADAAGNLPIEEGNWQTIVLTLFDYAGSSSILMRFNWSDGDSWASGFGIDNVVVGDLEENSLTLDKVVNGDWNQADFGLGFWDYSMIPLTQASPVHATGVVSNTGFNSLTNVGMTVEVLKNGTSVGSWDATPAAEILSLSKDTLSIAADYTPDAVGTYSVMATATSDAVESDVTDNDRETGFKMTDCTYARDLDAASAFMLLEGDEYSGNLFDIYNDETFVGISVAPGANSVAGAVMTGFIFEFQGFDANSDPIFEFVANSETEEVTIYENDLNSVNENNFTCLPFVEPVTLTAGGVYLVAVGATDTLRMPVSGSNVWVSSWNFTAGAYGATSGIPMVRLIGGACAEGSYCLTAVNEKESNNTALNQNTPNPANISTNISYVLTKPARTTLYVRDIAGHLVEAIELGNKSVGKHNYELNVEQYASGMYSYTINSGSTSVTRKMIVE